MHSRNNRLCNGEAPLPVKPYRAFVIGPQPERTALADSTFIFAHERLRQPTALTFDHHSGRDPPFESARRVVGRFH